jgi:hypothetical protein
MITRLARKVRIRRRPVFLVTGMLLMGLEVIRPDTMAFVPGMLLVALGVPDARPLDDTFAMVRTWAWLHEGRVRHR